jgi:hypothetical protein
MRCNAAQDGFELDESCGSGLCDMPNGECDVCFANAYECNAGARRVCNSDGQGYSAAPCTGDADICTGNGACVECLSNGDCTQPTNQCRQARCEAGDCVTSNRVIDTACSMSGGRVCDGAGNCVECNFTSDCPDGFCSNETCVECLNPAHCSAGACETASCSSSGTCSTSPTDGNGCGSNMVCNAGECETACGNGRVDTGIVPAEQCDTTVSPHTWYNCNPATCRQRTYYTVCNGDTDCDDSDCLTEPSAQFHMCAPPCAGSDTANCPIWPGGSRTDDGTPGAWLLCANSDCAIACRPVCFGDGSCNWAGAECPPHLRCQQIVGDVGACVRP